MGERPYPTLRDGRDLRLNRDALAEEGPKRAPAARFRRPCGRAADDRELEAHDITYREVT